jgi:hypothetical protein|tara:strand:+ start:8019 stop:8153 length:135 start_codon:yes stop_codon:yes gene_type:complete
MGNTYHQQLVQSLVAFVVAAAAAAARPADRVEFVDENNGGRLFL